MLFDANEHLPESGRLNTQISVVGSGLAGLALAGDLSEAGHEVKLFEGGELKLSETSMDSYTGTCTISDQLGRKKRRDDYLHTSRLRMLGGTANHWGGSITYLDALDFEDRPWVPGGGWPIKKEELREAYIKASKYLLVKYPGTDNADIDSPYPEFDLSFSDALSNTFSQRSQVATARDVHLPQKIRSVARQVDIYYNATLVKLVFNGKRVSEIEFRNEQRDRLRVRSDIVLLCCGGIENARILLLHEHEIPINNRNTGRYFMEHIVFGNCGAIHFPNDSITTQLYDHPKGFEGYFELSEAYRRNRALQSLKIGLRRTDESPYSFAGARRSENESGSVIDLRLLIGEAAPNRNSRVKLSTQKDAFGMPRVHLDWRVSQSDYRHMLYALRTFAREFGRTQKGRVRLDLDEAMLIDHIARFHHMGTTRMHHDPEFGVTDRYGRVHGLENLYLGGSSLFTTSGSAHPTINLLALAYWTSEHLKSEVLG